MKYSTVEDQKFRHPQRSMFCLRHCLAVCVCVCSKPVMCVNCLAYPIPMCSLLLQTEYHEAEVYLHLVTEVIKCVAEDVLRAASRGPRKPDAIAPHPGEPTFHCTSPFQPGWPPPPVLRLTLQAFRGSGSLRRPSDERGSQRNALAAESVRERRTCRVGQCPLARRTSAWANPASVRMSEVPG